MGGFEKVKLLLDTHIWIWSLMSPEKLSNVVVQALENKNNEIGLSPISVWEALILIEKGRIILNISAEQWIKQALKQTPIKEAPLTYEVAIKSRFIKLPHQDPADRFISATALVYGMTLVTADGNIASSKEIPLLIN
jgi:PIN domain nuclease of toxin-antitoxin system